MLSVAFLGPIGTFSHQVAYEYFGNEVTYVSRPSITNVFTSLSPEVPLVCMPLANSTHGAVIETLDALRSDRWSKDAFIRDEITLKIEHCLVVSAFTGLSPEEDAADILKSIVCVYSHEQALGQCANWLSKHLPAAKRVKVESTAAAAERLVTKKAIMGQQTAGREAAICSEMCIRTVPGLRLLQRNIQDRDDNQTRFIVVGCSSTIPLPARKLVDKVPTRTLLRISPRNSNLGSILSLISATSQTLSVERINCRPQLEGKTWSDVYFVELSKNSAQNLEESIGSLLAGLKLGSDAVILGSW